MEKMATRKVSNLGTRLADKAKEIRELKLKIKAHEKTIKQQDDEFNAYVSDYNELAKKLKQREEKHSFIVTEHNGYITSIVETQPFNVCVAFQEVEGINLLEITKTALYRKFPFLKINNGNIEINEEQYKKYKLGGII